MTTHDTNYIVFKNADGDPIGLPVEVNLEAKCDAAIENKPVGCYSHGVYTKEWLILHEYFVEEDFHIRGD